MMFTVDTTLKSVKECWILHRFKRYGVLRELEGQACRWRSWMFIFQKKVHIGLDEVKLFVERQPTVLSTNRKKTLLIPSLEEHTSA